jgi:hypothetical protein
MEIDVQKNRRGVAVRMGERYALQQKGMHEMSPEQRGHAAELKRNGSAQEEVFMRACRRADASGTVNRDRLGRNLGATRGIDFVMSTVVTNPPGPATFESARWKVWTGRVLSALPALAMIPSAAMKISHAPKFLEAWEGRFGYPVSAATALGIVELTVLALYLIPRTRILGGILLVGYLGGAIATHVRVGDPFVVPLFLGILAWGGLYLRDGRLQQLLPLVKDR